MNVQQYIASGILEEFCLGLLDARKVAEIETLSFLRPEIKNEIDLINQSLYQYAATLETSTPSSLKQRTWETIENLDKEEKISSSELPLLSRFSNHYKWLSVIKNIIPNKLDSDLYYNVIRDDEKVTQTILWTKVDYPDEVHDDLQESFIILEGECECYVGDKVIRLTAGDYFEIPLYAHHDVKVLSPYVLAVIQRKKIVA